ncbi:YccT family protein [Vibrio intestinalis]|uniref:YccT family protein n=1 Tax=Vibrio intestinalis TaxID=2933291 RepID=UPI0021A36547|nr:DUF2057 domain-containing protein [Vibrio intestinalis]
MKVMKTLLAIGVMTASFAPHAEVGLNFHHELAPIIIDGEEQGFANFTSDSDFTLDNGTNQIVFRMEKLIDGQGDREKFNSHAFVLSFTAKDTQVSLKPTMRVLRTTQAQAFNQDPKVALVDKNGKHLDFTLDVLPPSNAIMRDYTAELASFNKEHGITVQSKNTAQIVAQTASIAPSLAVEPNEIGPESMIQYWLKKASTEESETFVNWAFANRTVENPQGLEGSKALSMLSHWYSEADVNQRKQILAWLVSQ